MTVRVKICGLTNVDDAVCAAEAGADMLGFIFATKSPRYITSRQARAVVGALADALSGTGLPRPKLVGVFVDSDFDEVALTMATAGLDYAQLHGSESIDFLKRLDGRAFRAIRPRLEPSEDDLSDALAHAAMGVANGPRLLIDAFSPHAHGGTGEKANWGHASTLAGLTDGLVLAGGLTPANVGDAIEAVHPWAVDTSSGVESAPGRKDHESIRAFVRAAKVAGA